MIFKTLRIHADPHDPKSGSVSHYHLGMWCFETASQSSISRWTKSLVYTEPPSSSYTEALSHFLRAEEVAPGWEHIGNSIGIARQVKTPC